MSQPSGSNSCNTGGGSGAAAIAGVQVRGKSLITKLIRGLYSIQLTRPHIVSRHLCTPGTTMGHPSQVESTSSNHRAESTIVDRTRAVPDPMISTFSGVNTVCGSIGHSTNFGNINIESGTHPIPLDTMGTSVNHSITDILQIRDNLSASDIRRTIRGIWSTRGASFFACFLCCVNFYTISRFSMLAYLLKGSFLVQFTLLSIIFGLPLLLFLISLGQYLGSGFLDMWFISPAFKGIGAAFLFTYAAIGVYQSVPIAWLFVYFRDSFLATPETPYKWSYCSTKYSDCVKALNLSRYEYIGWSVTAYFRNQVMVQGTASGQQTSENAKINTAFNLALIWAMTFIILSRGLKSAGKLFVILSVVPLILFAMVSVRFLQEFGSGVERLFSPNGKPFLTDSISWLLAAREVFIVWVSFGGVALNVASHNKGNHYLIKQIIILFALVLVTLLLSSCFFASTMEVLQRRNITYTFSSYEDGPFSTFLKSQRNGPIPTKTEPFLISGSNFFIGENLIGFHEINSRLSHYNVLRFATEVFPAALSLEGAKSISSFWAMSFYLSAILLNIGSLLVTWGSVVEAIISIYPQSLRLWKSIVTILCCLGAYFLALPMVYGNGIHILYYFDFTFGSLWWFSLLYLLLIIAVLIIRGRPCGAENLVAILCTKESIKSWLLPSLTFHWNLITPVIIMILSIAFTRSYSINGLTWTQLVALYPHWPHWAQCLAIVLQIMPLLIIFLCGILQAVLYLCFNAIGSTQERLQALFCPIVSIDETPNSATILSSGVVNDSFIDEPPPKYTPPPSYSAATSMAVLKELRNNVSFPTVDLRLTTDPNLSVPSRKCWSLRRYHSHRDSSQAS